MEVVMGKECLEEDYLRLLCGLASEVDRHSGRFPELSVVKDEIHHTNLDDADYALQLRHITDILSRYSVNSYVIRLIHNNFKQDAENFLKNNNLSSLDDNELLWV
jgi:hypothetical protein